MGLEAAIARGESETYNIETLDEKKVKHGVSVSMSKHWQEADDGVRR